MSTTTSVSPFNRLGSLRQPAVALTALCAVQGAFANTVADATKEEANVLPQLSVEDTKPKGISSPKFTQPLQDTPQTVVVIPSEIFRQQGASNLSDVLRNTSGITFAAGEGGNASATAGDSFYLRGFDTTNNIFIDGVRDVGAYSRDVFNVDQVEVVKGPSGSDVGRGGASGYVNLTTKMPTLENFYAGTASYGFDEKTSGARLRSTIDINQSLEKAPVQGTAVRLNAMWQDYDTAGRNYANSRSWSVAPSVAFGLKTPTRVFFSYQHTEQDNLPDYGLPSALMPGYISPVPIPSVDRSTFYGFTADHDNVNADAAELRIEHDFSPDLKLTNQTRYSSNQRDAIVTTPGTSSSSYVPATNLLTRSRQANKRDMSITSNQTNLTGSFATGVIKHDFTGGIELSRETAYQPAFTSVTLTPIALQSPNPDGTPSATPTRSGAYTNVATKTGAVYAGDTLKFTDHWELNVSLRGEHYTTESLSVPVANGAATFVQAGDDIFSWKTGLVYKPVKNGSLYVAYANSFTPPGTDFTLSSVAGNQNNPNSDPQQSTNIEAGVKWDFFKGKLSTTAAIFKTTNDNTVFTDPILGSVPTGKQSVQGAEFGISRRFTDNWVVLGSISYLDSEIDSGTIAGGSLAGSPLPLIPKYSGNLYTSYRFSSGLILGGGGQYSDAVQRRDNNSPQVPRTMPSYWLFNGNVSYPIAKNVTVRFNVNNLFDRIYVQSFNNNGARYSPGAPRNYQLAAEFKF